MPSWICDIPGADAATIGWHATLHLGLAAVVLGAGTAFLLLAVRAYRGARSGDERPRERHDPI